jgi:hypothetical protein
MDNNYNGYEQQPNGAQFNDNPIPNQTVYTQDPAATGEPKPQKGMAIASMVCGILSVTICCGTGLLAIVAIVLGIISIKKPGCKGMALAGIICGAIGLVFTVIYVIMSLTGTMGEIMEGYNY